MCLQNKAFNCNHSFTNGHVNGNKLKAELVKLSLREIENKVRVEII
jgi:hypothetical protein